jgi:hypothetical protein
MRVRLVSIRDPPARSMAGRSEAALPLGVLTGLKLRPSRSSGFVSEASAMIRSCSSPLPGPVPAAIPLPHPQRAYP